jgi:ubiquinone biosynthesis O-methyltransferase
VLEGMKAIDIGCGAGILSESLTRLGLGSVTGIDPTDKCISLAEEHLDGYSKELKERLSYKNTTLEAVLEEKKDTPSDQLYDLVCCSEVLEHVDNQE